MVPHSSIRCTNAPAPPFIKAWQALAACAALAFGAAWAQPTAPAGKPTSRADPTDARSTAPALVFRSSLDDYRRYTDISASGWREANDTVTRIGGWRAYAREAQQPVAPPAAPPSGTRGDKTTPAPAAAAATSAPWPAPAASASTQAPAPAATDAKAKSAAHADHAKH